MRRTIWGGVVLALGLVACGDDPASPPPIPDLRMDDVVGCWEKVDEFTAYYQCFDSSGAFSQHLESSDGVFVEDTGRFWLDSYYVKYKASWVASNGRSGRIDVGMEIYRRENDRLVIYDANWVRTETAYTRVDLARDTVFIRKHIFQLLPKPADWTLF